MQKSRRVPACLVLALLFLAPATVTAGESGSASATEQSPENAAALLAEEATNEVADAGQPVPGNPQSEEPEPIGMDRPLDGSSLDSFNAGLAQVEQEVSPREFNQLKAAIEKLLFYDISAKRDRELLYQRLNGKTPKQIIERAK